MAASNTDGETEMRSFKAHYAHWQLVYEKLDALGEEYQDLPPSRITKSRVLLSGVQMLECILDGVFSHAVRLTYRSMPVPLALLRGTLRDKVRGQPTPLLDEHHSKTKGRRPPYPPWAYRQIKEIGRAHV